MTAGTLCPSAVTLLQWCSWQQRGVWEKDLLWRDVTGLEQTGRSMKWWWKRWIGAFRWILQGLPLFPGLPSSLRLSLHSEDQEAEIHSKHSVVAMTILQAYQRHPDKPPCYKSWVCRAPIPSDSIGTCLLQAAESGGRCLFPGVKWGHPHAQTKASYSSLLWKFQDI